MFHKSCAKHFEAKSFWKSKSTYIIDKVMIFRDHNSAPFFLKTHKQPKRMCCMKHIILFQVFHNRFK